MADSDDRNDISRWVDQDRNAILVNVLAGTTVSEGDLMFVDNATNLRNDGSSEATYSAFPISYLRISGSSLELNRAEVKDVFLGVALEGKYGVSNGVSRTVSIATTGVFKYDLKPARTVHNYEMFGPSGTTTASNMFDQKIAKTTNSNAALGYFAEYKVHALTAEVFIRSAFGPYQQV